MMPQPLLAAMRAGGGAAHAQDIWAPHRRLPVNFLRPPRHQTRGLDHFAKIHGEFPQGRQIDGVCQTLARVVTAGICARGVSTFGQCGGATCSADSRQRLRPFGTGDLELARDLLPSEVVLQLHERIACPLEDSLGGGLVVACHGGARRRQPRRQADADRTGFLRERKALPRPTYFTQIKKSTFDTVLFHTNKKINV